MAHETDPLLFLSDSSLLAKRIHRPNKVYDFFLFFVCDNYCSLWSVEILSAK